MKAPSLEDRIVECVAYLTDESFGYDHWRAAQFSAPQKDKLAVLLLFDTEEERAEWMRAMALQAIIQPGKR